MAEAYVLGARGERVYCDAEAAPSGQGLRMQYLVNDLANLAASLRTRTPIRGNALRDLFSPNSRGGVFDIGDLSASWAYCRGLLRKGGGS
jgi:hypothetical protein